LAALGHPERRLPPVVHVAGTNGKGSYLAFTRAIAEALGKGVHVYTSPHLPNFHERIVLAGPHGSAPIGEDFLVDCLARAEAAKRGELVYLFDDTPKVPAAVICLLCSRSPGPRLPSPSGRPPPICCCSRRGLAGDLMPP